MFLKILRIVFLITVSMCYQTFFAVADAPSPVHGIAMRGQPKYGPGFTHFAPFNPKAPKGGTIRIPVIGTVFDTLNPFLTKGICARGLGLYEYLIFDTLMMRSPDEPFSLYGHLAEKVSLSPNRDKITFYMNPAARFQNSDPVRASDVVFTFRTLEKYGSPLRKMLARKIKEIQTGKAQLDGKNYETVTFIFHLMEGSQEYDQELPLIIAGMPVLSENSLKGKNFSQTGLEPLMGSGPYRIKEVKPGQMIVFERDPHYWGKDLPALQGLYNFETIAYEYFGSDAVAFEAFKKGVVTHWTEDNPNRWAHEYTFPALTSGKIHREEMHFRNAAAVTTLIFNTHRGPLKDSRVRQALGYLVDFEWINAKLFNQSLNRTASFFGSTPFAADGLPSKEEKEILGSLPDLPAAIWGPLPEWTVTDGSGNMRPHIEKAHQLLKQAGWSFDGTQWTKGSNEEKQTLIVELLLSNPQMEKVALAYQRVLKQAGISLIIRTVDSAQYQKRINDREFDMMLFTFGTSLSPGGEQKLYWLSDFAHVPSRNYAGIESKAIDKVCDLLSQATSQESVVTIMRVLDRLLRHGFYMRPLYNKSMTRVAYWVGLAHTPPDGQILLSIYSWWFKDSSSTRLAASSIQKKAPSQPRAVG